jgi:hypothetical protein
MHNKIHFLQKNYALFDGRLRSFITKDNEYTWWFLVLLSCLVVGSFFVFSWNLTINIQDEGYLWYGTQQVNAGLIPVRDFESYDPLRYYFISAVQFIVQDTSIWSVRLTSALISALCVFLVLQVLTKNIKQQFSIVALIIVAISSSLWMYPTHKVYDILASLLILCSLGYWIDRSSLRTAFVVGLLCAVAAQINRNHGLYAAVGTLCVLVWIIRHRELHWKAALQHLLFIAMGCAIGLLPFVSLMLFVPGFGDAFLKYQVLYFLEVNATNLYKPIPWPWTVTVTGRSWVPIGSQFLIGVLFCFVILAGIVSWIILAWRWYTKQTHRLNPYFVASAVLVPVYAHHVFSRADLGHLTQGFMPVLLLATLFLREHKTIGWNSVFIAFVVARLLVMIPVHPLYICRNNACPSITIQGVTYQGNRQITTRVENIVSVIEQNNATNSFAIVPYSPGIYALLQATSPIYFSYNVYAQTRDEEQKQILQLEQKRVKLVLVDLSRVDGRKDLGFQRTSPLTYAFILSAYTYAGKTSNYEVYLRNP